MNFRKKTGRGGEAIASRYLKGCGYRIIAENFACRSGEIDIIAKKGAELHFVEVKARTSKFFGPGPEAVNHAKQHKLVRAALFYLNRHERYKNSRKCFSVIGIDHTQVPEKVTFYPHAFDVEGGYY